MRSYRVTTGDGRSTEELVEAGNYGYVHSCMISENFPVRQFGGLRTREIVLLEFDHDVTADEVIEAAAGLGLGRSTKMLSTSVSSTRTCSANEDAP